MIPDWLRKLLTVGAPHESDTERDGLLSYGAEWHAFEHGLYDGMKSINTRPGALPDNEDVQAEPHYYKGAYVLGTLLQFTLIAVVGYVGHGAV